MIPIYPDSSRFFRSDNTLPASSPSLARLLPGIPLPELFPALPEAPGPIPAGDPQPLPAALPRTKERGISGSGAWHGSGNAGIRGFGGHRSSCLHPETFPPSPTPLPDLGNDSGDRNPGLGSSELRDEWDYSSLDKIPWEGAGRGGGNEWPSRAGCELRIAAIPPGSVNDPN